jgi:energy-coupling factor transporter ATP-binding protein EcfA2
MSEDLSKVVLTSAYHRAADALDQHGFVLLIGEPAPGKTTIASMLSMGQPRTSGMTAQRSRDEYFPHISLANRESSSSWTEFCWRVKDASYRALSMSCPTINPVSKPQYEKSCPSQLGSAATCTS